MAQALRERHRSAEAFCTSGGRFSIIGVAIRPGAIASTRMPLRAKSRAAGKVRPTMPAFEAA